MWCIDAVFVCFVATRITQPRGRSDLVSRFRGCRTHLPTACPRIAGAQAAAARRARQGGAVGVRERAAQGGALLGQAEQELATLARPPQGEGELPARPLPSSPRACGAAASTQCLSMPMPLCLHLVVLVPNNVIVFCVSCVARALYADRALVALWAHEEAESLYNISRQQQLLECLGFVLNTCTSRERVFLDAWIAHSVFERPRLDLGTSTMWTARRVASRRTATSRAPVSPQQRTQRCPDPAWNR